jgi:hypothetical protein
VRPVRFTLLSILNQTVGEKGVCVMNSTTPRRMTIVDGMILVAGFALGIWVSEMIWIPRLKMMASIAPDVWAANPVRLMCHWGSLVLRHTQPIAAVLTLTMLLLRLLPPRPDIRRLSRQPGFAACGAASIAICIGGGLNYATTTAIFVAGFETRGYTWVALFPKGSEPGIAISACWALLALGRRWRSERSWIDRLGRLLGVYWLAMIVIARLAPQY